VEDQLNVSLKPEPINIFGFQPEILGFKITNSVFTFIVVCIVLVILMLSATLRPKLVPGRWQALWEVIIEALLNLVESSLGRTKLARRLFVLIATLFIFILFANWFSLIPGVGSFGYEEHEIVAGSTTDKLTNGGYGLLTAEGELRSAANESSQAVANLASNTAVKVTSIQGDWAQVSEVPHTVKAKADFTPVKVGGKEVTGFLPVSAITPSKVGRIIIPILRPPNADLNMTLAMALISVITANIIAIVSHGVGGWIKEFFPKPYAMDPLLTPLEIVGQFARIISLTFRLFGNIFAGEVLLAIILRIAAPALVIFMGLELFFGLIQALVFSMLTLAYMSLAIAGGGGEDHGHGAHAEEDHGHAEVAEPVVGI
jgi:F-type H+-transporting ATPase subunit a